jgi:PBP1b-binding outer membrane lipoprotein LpoB
MLNFKSLKEMKKVILFFVLAMAFASCKPKATETAPKADSTVVAVDSTKAAVDTTKVDTTKVK